MTAQEGKTILLVEDETLIAMHEKSLLERNGFAVQICRNGENAIEAIENDPEIDLILMDINLGPGMDGTEAAKAILKKRDIPVLFLSSHTEPDIVRKTETITSYGYVVKNSGETVLITSIKMAFRLFEAKMMEGKREAELLESEQRFAQILGLVPDMISIHDSEMNILYSNWQGFAAIPESERVLKTKCYKTYRGFDQTCPDCLAKRVLETKLPMQEVTMLPDGTWFDIRVIPLVDAEGRVTVFMEWVRDITELKQSEKELRLSDSRFQLIAKVAPVGILISDERENTLYVNRKFTDLFGYTLEDMPTVDCWWPLAYPDVELQKRVKREWEAEIGKAWATRSEITPLDYPVTCKNGHVRQTEFRMGTTGEYNIVVFSDISERKKAQDVINSLLEEKDLLLRETHHRVRNNMYTIKSMLSLQAVEHEGDKAGLILNNAADRLDGMMILYDMLYRYKPDESIDMRYFLPPLLNEINTTFGAKIPINTRVQASELLLPSRTVSCIGIIINELITNAMKYAFTDRDDPRIEVTVNEHEKLVSVCVEDNGVGLPSAVDIETPEGFGLQMVKLLAQQIDGSLQLDRDGGTKITISFPI